MINEQPYYKLKTLIKKKGYTQREFAEKIGMDNPTFSLKINRTKGRDFWFSEAVLIAEKLEVDLSELI